MWNEVLKRIDSTQTPQNAVKRWKGDASSVHLVSDGINLVYRFEKKSQGYYLRLTHAELRKEDEIQAAIAYQRHLFNCGAKVCEPLVSNNGLWVEAIQQDQDLFLAHVCREVPGQPIHYDYHDLALYEEWGKTLGQFHRAAQTFQPGHHDYTNWQKSLEELHDYARHESKSVQKILCEVTDYFTARKQTLENYGLTHGDPREGNVLTDGHQIHIIDFDLPSQNWFMEDVVRPFFHPIVHDENNWQDKFPSYLKGYLAVMPKESIDLTAFPKQIQMKCLEIYLWTKNNWNAEEAPGGDDALTWLDRIYQKIVDSSWIEKLPL